MVHRHSGRAQEEFMIGLLHSAVKLNTIHYGGGFLDPTQVALSAIFLVSNAPANLGPV